MEFDEGTIRLGNGYLYHLNQGSFGCERATQAHTYSLSMQNNVVLVVSG
jgi:hypothetical protein